MNVMVIGGGGREHAVIKKLKGLPEIDALYALPGNGGIAMDATCVPIGAKDIPAIVSFAKEKNIDFSIVTPDDPLVLGCVDALEEIGVRCFGPNKKAAIIEGSKVFSKQLMKKYEIPTASYEVFEKAEDALAYLQNASLPAVIKADGLALGKGVLIAQTRDEAYAAVRSIMQEHIFGDSGNRIIIEEFLTGPEISVLAFTDGKTVKPMVSSMDHKRAHDGDEGLNTGGMGTIAPNPFYTPEVADVCMNTIFLPTIRAMNAEGRTFKGCLYFGLMLTENGPKVIEYNCRFGDPEAQVVLPLLESNLLSVMQAVADGTLAETDVKFSDKASCCVVVASDGYPQKYEKGFPIQIADGMDAQVLFAGVKQENGTLLTNGGRVLCVVATGNTLPEAIDSAYRNVPSVQFQNAYYRKDIGQKALSVLRERGRC